MTSLLIPARCRHVYACLAGHTEKPLHVRMTGKWSNKDLQEITGQSAADVRMRELLRMNAEAIESEIIPGSKCGAKQFWLKSRPLCPSLHPEQKSRQVQAAPLLFAIDSEVL